MCFEHSFSLVQILVLHITTLYTLTYLQLFSYRNTYIYYIRHLLYFTSTNLLSMSTACHCTCVVCWINDEGICDLQSASASSKVGSDTCSITEVVILHSLRHPDRVLSTLLTGPLHKRRHHLSAKPCSKLQYPESSSAWWYCWHWLLGRGR